MKLEAKRESAREVAIAELSDEALDQVAGGGGTVKKIPAEKQRPLHPFLRATKAHK
jgi:hypothetical protein